MGREPVGHGERRRELERQFPGWEIWYVPRDADSATWRARPQMLIGADSPEDLAAAIRAAHSQVPSPDSLLLASPQDYPVRVRRLRELAEPAGAARRRAKAQKRRRVPRRRTAFRLAWPSASVSGPRHH
jgi:hypothetical protein